MTPGRKNYNLRKVCALLLGFLFLLSTAQAAKPENDWNVWFYVSGGDLESRYSSWTDNMIELEKNLPIRPGVAYFLDYGGSNTVAADWLRRGVPQEQRWWMTGNGWDLLEYLPETDMAAGRTLSRYLMLMKDNPAKHNVLVLWGHGGGTLNGMFYDERTGNMMSLAEIRKALGTALVPDENKPPFDVILLNSCLMCDIEVLNTFKGFGRYLVSSQEIVPGCGYDFEVLAGMLNRKPDCSAQELAVALAERYQQKCIEQGVGRAITVSVTDLAKTDEVTAAADNYAAALQEVAARDSGNITELARNAYWADRFGGGNNVTGSVFELIDLKGFAERTSWASPAAAEKLTSAIKNAVIYNRNGDAHENCGGISVYYPVSGNREKFGIFKKNTAGRPAFAGFYSQILNSKDCDISGLNRTAVQKDSNGMVNTVIGDACRKVTLVEYCLLRKGEKGTDFLGMSANIDGDWDNGVFTAQTDKKWPALNGKLLSVEIYDSNWENDMMAVPVYYNGKRCNLSLMYNNVSDSFSLLGIIENDANTFLARHYIEMPKAGDTMAVVNRRCTRQGDSLVFQEEKGEAFTLTGPLAIEGVPVPDGEYEISFRFSNARNEKAKTGFISVNLKDGKALN